MQVLSRYEPLLHEESFQAARLVIAARSGRRDAFDALMRLHEPALRAYVSSRIGAGRSSRSASSGSGDAVEDVLQETRVACWQMLPNYRGASRFRVWLLGIARHKCADYWRSQGARSNSGESGSVGPISLDDEAVARLADPSSSAFDAAELRIVVRDLLDALPAEQRDVLDLYYMGGLTLAETAKALGRNLNTVKAQFYRAHVRAVELLRLEPFPGPGSESQPTDAGRGRSAGRDRESERSA